MTDVLKNIKILLAAVIIFIRLSVAAAGNVIVTSLTANEGLSNNTVWTVMQDKSGYIWIGTAEGLDRFDGKEIRHFSPERLYGENHIVRCLCEDDNGKIWVGTYSGILVFDPVTEREEEYSLNMPEVDDTGFRVYQIIKDPGGKLWIPAGKYGFFCIDPRTGEARRITASSDGSVSYWGSAMCFDGRDTFYLVMDDGNIYSSSDELASVTPLFSSRVLGYQPNKLSYAFGCLFTGEAEDNIKIDIRKKEISRTPWSVIRVPATEPNDELLTSSRDGFHILGSDLQEKQEISMDAGSRLAFQGKSIMCACRDRDGNFWVGTYYSGVFHLINNRANLRKYYPRYIDDDEPSHVSEIIPDSDGTLWVATEDKGLLRFSPEQGSFSPVKLPITVLNITALGSDGPYLWIGAFAQSHALARLDRRDGSVILFEGAPPRVGSICPRRDGSVAIGGAGGLYILRDGRFVQALRINDVVRNVMEDSHGHLWLSTGKEGLWLCQGDPASESAKWVHYENDPYNLGSIPSNRVTSVFEDRESRIWVTTEFGGFCLLNPRTGYFTRYSDYPQTDYKVCYKISEDKNGIFWITTSKGLLCFNPKTNAASLLTRADGMLSNQYNYSSNIISPEGVLYVGSGDGLASFEPDKLLQWQRNSGILLADFQVVEPRREKRSRFRLPGSVNTLTSVSLPHQYNSFRIKVVTDNYSIPVVSRLVYRLEGLDSEWTDIQDGLIEINKLRSGKYRLNIRVERIDGGAEPDGRMLEIHIRPPALAGAPAILAYLLLLVSAFWLFRWWMLRNMKKQQEMELLSAQMDFVTTIAHEIKTPLTLVQGSMELLKGKTTGKEDRDNLDIAFRNMDRIRELISQLQDFSSIQARGLAVRSSWINLSEEADSVFRRFILEARSNQKDFSIHLPDHHIYSLADRDAVDKIMTNLFSNAIKYADSFARVSVSDKNGKFRLSVVNDGMVVPPEMADRIFEPFVRYSENSRSVSGTGIGLYTSRKLARMLGGDILFRQTEDGFNEFSMEIPIQIAPDSRSEVSPQVVLRQPERKTADDMKTILVVEDTLEMKDFIVARLKPDYRVLEASNGDEALKVLSSGAVVHLILSDVMMPGMDGFELCRKVKENIITSHIPVILLTARTDMGSKIEGLEYGADMYLEKPFSLDHLKAAIGSVFENREKLRMHYLSRPLETDAAPSGSSADSDFLKRFVTFVEDNIENESLRIADIALAVCVSESNLYKKTKALIGMSPLEYVQFIRLKVAESLLSGTDSPISDIVTRTGFRSHPYFSACFKKQYGMTPGQYRKKNSH